jgi:hypothetical protein
MLHGFVLVGIRLTQSHPDFKFHKFPAKFIYSPIMTLDEHGISWRTVVIFTAVVVAVAVVARLDVASEETNSHDSD